MIRSRQRALQFLAEGGPELRWVDRQDLVLADRDVAPVLQLLAEGGRDRQPSLVVHPHPMRPREQRSLAPPAALAGAPGGVHPPALAAGAEAAAAAVKFERQH